MKRKALGKGLSALLPAPEPDTRPREQASDVAVELLEPNPYQPRSSISSAGLDALVASVQQSGIVQPILVRRFGSRYQIIAGERRWRAARRAGLARVPVVVRDVPDDRLLELALVENIQREDLGALEEAEAFRRLQEELHLTQEEVARRVGRERSTVANTLRLLRLGRPVRDLLAQGRIEAGHARALLALDGAEDQAALAREAAQKGLSVREVERRVAQIRAPAATRGAKRRDANTRAAEERLRAALGTRVEISRRGKGGALRLRFGSEAELNRLFELLLRAGMGKSR